jgi:fructose-bisphosphate aldolase class 1
MKLSDLSTTPAQKMRSINSYLKENFGYTLKEDGLDQAKIARALDQLNKQQWDITCKVADYHNDSSYIKNVLMAESLRLLSKKAPHRKGLSESVARLRVLLEQDLEQAEVALAAKSMAEDVKEMAEKIAKMQVETLMALVDTMKITHGQEQAQQFNDAVESTLQTLLDTLKQTHDDLGNAAAVVAGEEGASFMNSSEEPAPQDDGEDFSDMGNDEESDIESGDLGDGISGAPAASGPRDQAVGRELK